MRSVPERPVLLTFVVFMGALFSGPFLGLRLGTSLAPESDLAQIASIMAFPLAFCAGIVFWLGLGVITVVAGALLNLVRGRLPAAADLSGGKALVPPGYGSFVVFSVFAAGAAGLLVWLLSAASFLPALATYAASGALYGCALWWLAHHGYLPFPEPE